MEIEIETIEEAKEKLTELQEEIAELQEDKSQLEEDNQILRTRLGATSDWAVEKGVCHDTPASRRKWMDTE